MRNHRFNSEPMSEREKIQYSLFLFFAFTVAGIALGTLIGYFVALRKVNDNTRNLFKDCAQENGATTNGGWVYRENIECPNSMSEQECTDIFEKCKDLALTANVALIVAKNCGIGMASGGGLGFLTAVGLFGCSRLKSANPERQSLIEEPMVDIEASSPTTTTTTTTTTAINSDPDGEIEYDVDEPPTPADELTQDHDVEENSSQRRHFCRVM